MRSKRRVLPTGAAFWILAVLFLMVFFATAAASPLYRVYQAQFHFSASTLTAVIDWLRAKKWLPAVPLESSEHPSS